MERPGEMGRSLWPHLALCGGAASEVTSELGQTLTTYPHSPRNILYVPRLSSQILRDTLTSNRCWCYSRRVCSFESERLQMGLSKDSQGTAHRPDVKCVGTKWGSSAPVTFMPPAGGLTTHRASPMESKAQQVCKLQGTQGLQDSAQPHSTGWKGRRGLSPGSSCSSWDSTSFDVVCPRGEPTLANHICCTGL